MANQESIRTIVNRLLPTRTPKIPISGVNAGRFPVVLYDNVTVIGGKGPISPNVENMMNQYRTPIVVTEINFLLECSNGGQDQGPFAGLQNIGPLIRVKLEKGRLGLTDGFVPIQLLGPRYQSTMEEFTSVAPASTGQANFYGYYKWVLPVPLIVGIGESVTPSFLWQTPLGGFNASGVVHASALVNRTVICHVSLIGQQVNADPGSAQQIPWVSAWVPIVGQTNSSDQDLMNKFNVPLRVQRLCQRTAKRIGATLEGWTAATSLDGSSNLNQFTMQDSQGYDIVRDKTSFVDVIDQNRMAWTFNQVIEPRGRIKVTLLDATSATYIPWMSIVGYREEQVG